jgi:hypothetical protein
MDILQDIHSLVRWLIVLAAIAGLIIFALVWLRGYRNPGMERGLRSAFSGLIDIQVVLGVILLIGKGLVNYRIEHAVPMVLAAGLAHAPAFWRKTDPQTNARNNFLVIVGVLVLVAIGISVLPQGWLG